MYKEDSKGAGTAWQASPPPTALVAPRPLPAAAPPAAATRRAQTPRAACSLRSAGGPGGAWRGSEKVVLGGGAWRGSQKARPAAATGPPSPHRAWPAVVAGTRQSKQARDVLAPLPARNKTHTRKHAVGMRPPHTHTHIPMSSPSCSSPRACTSKLSPPEPSTASTRRLTLVSASAHSRSPILVPAGHRPCFVLLCFALLCFVLGRLDARKLANA